MGSDPITLASNHQGDLKTVVTGFLGVQFHAQIWMCRLDCWLYSFSMLTIHSSAFTKRRVSTLGLLNILLTTSHKNIQIKIITAKVKQVLIHVSVWIKHLFMKIPAYQCSITTFWPSSCDSTPSVFSFLLSKGAVPSFRSFSAFRLTARPNVTEQTHQHTTHMTPHVNDTGGERFWK